MRSDLHFESMFQQHCAKWIVGIRNGSQKPGGQPSPSPGKGCQPALSQVFPSVSEPGSRQLAVAAVGMQRSGCIERDWGSSMTGLGVHGVWGEEEAGSKPPPARLA